MTDFEIFLERLRYESESSASTWELLRLFHENDFDPALAMRILRMSRDQEIRVDAAGFYIDEGDPTRKIAAITDTELDKVDELVRSDPTIVTLPVEDIREQPNSRTASSGDPISPDERSIQEAAATYVEARPRLAEALSFTWLQNRLRGSTNRPLFSIAAFEWDVRDFLVGTLWKDKCSEPFYILSVMKIVDDIVKATENSEV